MEYPNNLVKCELNEIRTSSTGRINFEFIDVTKGTIYTVPGTTNFNYRKGQEYGFHLVTSQTGEYIIPVEISYHIGDEVYLNVTGNSEVISNGKRIKLIKCKDKYGREVNVRPHAWQIQEDWNVPKIKVRIERFKLGGELYVRNIDFRSDVYEVDKVYTFKIVGFDEATTKDGRKLKILKLNDADGRSFTVSHLNGVKTPSIGEQVLCKVRNIGSVIRLSEFFEGDPFYIDPSDILHSKVSLARFRKALNDQEQNNIRLTKQYEEKRAFWLLTYVADILPKLFNEAIRRKDFAEALQIAEDILLIEDRVQKSGLIGGLKQNERGNAKLKIDKSIEYFGGYVEFLKDLIGNRVVESIEQIQTISFSRLRYIERSIINLTEDRIPYLVIKNILQKLDVSDQKNRFYLNKIEYAVYRNNLTMQSALEIRDFKLLRTSESIVTQYQSFQLFIESVGLERAICKLLNKKERVNELDAKALRFYSLTISNKREASLVLASCFRHLCYDVGFESFPLVNDGKEISIDIKNERQVKLSDTVLDEIRISNKTHRPITAKILKVLSFGFQVEFNGIRGILPKYLVKNKELKSWNYPSINGTIDVDVLYVSSFLGYWIAAETTDISFKPEKIEDWDSVYGSTIKGVIKSTTEHGVFISTPLGDGLLRKSEIPDVGYPWNKLNLEKCFPINRIAEFVVVKPENNNGRRLFLSINEFSNLGYHSLVEDFADFFITQLQGDLDFIGIDDLFEEITIETIESQLREMASIVETYGGICERIEDGIEQYNIARELYSGTADARSYLCDVFVRYFSIVKGLDDTWDKGDITLLNQVLEEIGILKDTLKEETLLVFPQTERLVKFSNLLTLFGKFDVESLKHLFEFSIKQSQDETNLRPIAKLILSNNLLESELQGSDLLRLSNIQMLGNYLKEGLISIGSEYSMLIKEKSVLLEKWRRRIEMGEGQTLEFKASFKTPVLSKTELVQMEQIVKEIEAGTKGALQRKEKLTGKVRSKLVIHSALKNIAAFANSVGGTVLVGVEDDMNILGIEWEMEALKIDRDSYLTLVDDTISNYFEGRVLPLIYKELLEFPSGTVLALQVPPISKSVFLLRGAEGKELSRFNFEFWVRRTASSVKLDLPEMIEYLNERSKKHNSLVNDNLEQD